MTYYRPVFVSEREFAHLWPDGRSDDARWEDCSPTSLVMLASACTGHKSKATLIEAEALRAAAGYGPLGGTDLSKLAPVAEQRYGIDLTRVGGFDAFWAALKPGTGAAIAGRFSGLAAGHTLRRFQPDFVGDHAVYVQRDDALDRVWWMDPLGPKADYVGQWVSKADLQRFMEAGWCFGILGKLAVVPTVTTRYSIVIAPNATVRIAAVTADGRISGWTNRIWGPTASSAPCRAPVIKAGLYSGSATVAYVTAGVFAGKWVGIGRGVSLKQG